MRHMLIAGLVLTLAGCERVVSIELPESTAQLVVEARLERVQGKPSGRQLFRLTTTDGYFSNRAAPAAHGAIVQVADDAGHVTPFTESSTEPGVYETSALVGEIGRRYTLTIDFQGERYRASETLLAVPPIDSLYFVPAIGIALGEGLRATIVMHDPRGVKNFYLWDQLVDGVRQVVSDTAYRIRVVQSDELVDGRMMSQYQPYDGVEVKPGQLVMVRQIALSEQSYRYYTALSDQTSNAGTPFEVPLASIRGNVENVTAPAHRALGYFMAGEVAEAQKRVP